jgi:hypothetical protein
VQKAEVAPLDSVHVPPGLLNLPSEVERKLTVPVGALPASGLASVTVATHLVALPRPTVDGRHDTEVDVATSDGVGVGVGVGFTFCVSIDDADSRKSVSPEYVATIE